MNIQNSTQLNSEQKAAITQIDRPMLVLAGAGTGKTRVITQKIIHLINNCGINAKRIAALTFTNKAAKEMKERITSEINNKHTRGLFVSTFHQLGLRFIRREHNKLDLKPGFSIFDQSDCLALIDELLLSQKIDPEQSSAGNIQQQISIWKNEFKQADYCVSHAEDDQKLLEALVYQEYQRLLRLYNAVDFDDLILLPTLLLESNAAVKEHWQNQLHYILVDEYQDTNEAQYRLIKLLAGVRAAITVVGDDDQSIYSWRGAKPENISQLQNDFPSLKVIKLEQNYRSTTSILNSANHLIANNSHLYEKALWSKLPPGDAISILACTHEMHEAQRITHEIIGHKCRHNSNFKDYAVLYRSHYQCKLLELCLQELQVPYKVSGGISFFARQEIRILMAYLRLLINNEDDNAFLRVINTPRRGIGKQTMEKLTHYANSRHLSLFFACKEMGLRQVLTKKACLLVDGFIDLIEESMILINNGSPLEALHGLIEDIDYENFLAENSSSPKSADLKMDNVKQLLSNIESMLKKNENADNDFHEIISKLVLLDIIDQQEQEDHSDRVQLSTLHAAKGLEFPYVYMIGVEENILPHQNNIDDDKKVEEERRLMYVGMTRAMRKLSISYAKNRTSFGEKQKVKTSRFLDELPENHLDWPGRGPEKTFEEKKALGKAHIESLQSLLN